MVVMKFGGTSVANCEAVSRIIKIVESRLAEKPVVVVSALSQVTDLLYDVCEKASKQNITEVEMLLQQLQAKHVEMCEEIGRAHV